MACLRKGLVLMVMPVVMLGLVFLTGPVAAVDAGQVINVTAKKFSFSPDTITLKKGVPATLVFTSLDKTHGFNCPDLHIRTDIVPDKSNVVRFVPDKTGTFPFHCDVFCGLGHGSMVGKIIVTE
jgi:cytochrome c oxidase subunit 2